MSPMIEPPSSLLLVVGREDFTPPTTFGGRACAATVDCIAVGVRSVADGPTLASFAESTSPGLVVLGRFTVESEGLLSLRDVHHREHDACGVEPGLVDVTVLGDVDAEPGEVVFVVAAG